MKPERVENRAGQVVQGHLCGRISIEQAILVLEEQTHT